MQMSETDTDTSLNLEPFRKRFRDRCVEEVETLRAILTEGELDTEPVRAKLVEVSHRIAGTGGIVGYMDASTQARDTETLILEGAPEKQVSKALTSLVSTLDGIIAEG